MKNLSKKTIETIGVDYVRYVNSNYGDLLKSYFDTEPEDINFPTWCMVMYTENYPNWQVNNIKKKLVGS
jgi:hypothetical protein